MHILVVGGNGFIGTHLCKELKKNNYVVSVLDRNIFNSRHNFCDYYIEDDIRNLKPHWFDTVDCVFDYAGISNDPTGNISPELTFEINDIARSDLALLAENVKIKNYIFASSCSVYGSGSSNDLLSEQSETDPLTPYAISALNAEEKLRILSSDNFRCTILRHGTVFGFSEKMRFDLVLNSMLQSALEKRKILINGNGLQLRPLLSLETLSKFILSYLKSSFFKDNDFELINLSDENFSVVSIAKVVKSSVEEYLGEKIDLEYGMLISQKIIEFKNDNNISNLDFISSHGHTVKHKPPYYSIQIGNGKVIRDLTNVTTINDFRSQDIRLGGQGAPLVPIGDKYLFGNYDSCLNLGGIANISFGNNKWLD